MKKVIVFLIGSMLVLAGCSKIRWKQKEKPNIDDVLVSTVWEIEEYPFNNIPLEQNCKVAHQLVYNKDKTGYYYYPSPCDSTLSDTLKFTWRTDQYMDKILFTSFDGKPFGPALILYVFIYDYDILRLNFKDPNNYSTQTSHAIDGHFKPKSN